jgi:propanediol utilization protein
MDKRELDKITKSVLSLLKERGFSVSESGSAKQDNEVHSQDKKEKSPFKMDPMLIPVAISDRAVVLNKKDIEICFGGTSLTRDDSLSIPGRDVYKETVTVSGPDGEITGVHVSPSPFENSQVELLSGDDLKLGINAPLRLCNDIESSPGIRIAGPSGSIELEEGAIIPMRKITVDPVHAEHFGVVKGQIVSVEVVGSRGGILKNVAVLIGKGYDCNCYLDVNERDAFCIGKSTMVKIVK